MSKNWIRELVRALLTGLDLEVPTPSRAFGNSLSGRAIFFEELSIEDEDENLKGPLTYGGEGLSLSLATSQKLGSSKS